MSASSSSSKIPADLRAMLFEEEYQDEVIEHMHHMETQTIAVRRADGCPAELKVVHASLPCRLPHRDPPDLPPSP